MKENDRALALPNPDHIGIVVKDVDKTVEYLSYVGIPGPWKIFYHTAGADGLMVGKPFKIRIAAAKVGSVVFELIQPIDNDSLWAQFLENRGEGLQHIAFSISNFDAWVSRLQAQGSTIVVGGRVSVQKDDNTIEAFGNPNGDRWCYLENRSRGGIVIELMDNLLGLAPLF